MPLSPASLRETSRAGIVRRSDVLGHCSFSRAVAVPSAACPDPLASASPQANRVAVFSPECTGPNDQIATDGVVAAPSGVFVRILGFRVRDG